MKVLPSDQFPGAEHQPLAYPGLRPDFSYLYYQGNVYEISPQGETYDDLWIEGSTGRVTLDAFLAARGNAPMSERHAVLAVGSNGCPGRLAEKYVDQPEVALPVFVGTLADTVVVYSRRLVSYGALPATYLHQPGVVSWLSVTMLTDEQLERMDETERVGEAYERIKVPGHFTIDGGPKVDNLTAYLDREILSYQSKPIRLKLFARKGPDWPIMDEPEVLSLVFDQAGILVGEPIERRHSQLLKDKTLRLQIINFVNTRMSSLMVNKRGQLSANPSIKCTRVRPTSQRPGSEGTYIVRLSPANVRRLKLKVCNGAYLNVSYGDASVLACLSVDCDLDDETIRMDQTLRTAICLEKIMQGSAARELVYDPERSGALMHPIAIQRSNFPGPSWIARRVKQEYIVCVLHHALSTDMETPIARLREEAMDILGIQKGDKVLLISENGCTKKIRCLPLDPTVASELPFDTMFKLRHPPCPATEYKELRLPWCTVDYQTRLDLDADPWQPIFVGREPHHAIVSELREVVLAVALAALGGSFVFPGYERYIVGLGLGAILVFIWLKIRSRI